MDDKRADYINLWRSTKKKIVRQHKNRKKIKGNENLIRAEYIDQVFEAFNQTFIK